MILKLLAITVLVFGGFCSAAQSSMSNGIPDEYSPVSPNAAEFRKYGNTPVSHYTGLTQVEIPLYSLKERELELPISISYHGSGIKVEQDPTWIGLGWSLNAGGAIVRSVRGIADEKALKGYLNRNNLEAIYKPDDDLWNYVSTTPQVNMDVYHDHEKYWYRNVDPAPDEFVFNFGGRVGRFTFDRSGNVIVDSKVKVQYEMVNPTGSHQDIVKWTITDESGVKYIFTAVERTDTHADKMNSHLQISNMVNETAWYLTEIVSPHSGSTIKLFYSNSTPISKVSSSECYFIQNATRIDTGCPQGPYRSTGSFIYDTWVHAIFLTRIETSTVDLTIETTQTPTDPNPVKISNILIKRKDGSLITRFTPTYEYSGTRFFLKSLEEAGSNDLLPPYEFEYEQTPIPVGEDVAGGLAYAAMDHWGYYCGPNPNIYHTKIPVQNVYVDENGPSINGPDRTPNFNYMKAGVLLKIKYPMGGWTSFEYEQNAYSFLGNGEQKNATTLAGGLRIKEVRDNDGLNQNNTVVRKFYYINEDGTSSGVIEADPVYKYDLNIPDNSHNTATSGEIWFGEPIGPMDIGYRRVVEEIPGNGKTVYKYMTRGEFANPYVLLNKTFMIHGFSLPLYGSNNMLFQKISHPFVNSVDMQFLTNGKLRSKEIFDDAGQIKKREQHEYQYTEIGRVAGAASRGVDSYDYGACLSAPRAIWFYHQYVVPIGRVDLIGTLITDYASNGQALTSNTNYEYSDLNYLVSAKYERNSANEAIHTIYKYPLDFSVTAMNGQIGTLASKNIIGVPIHEITTVNGHLVFGRINELNSFGKPVKTFLFENVNSSPVSYSFNPNQIIPNTQLFKERESFEYNQFQRPITSKKTYDASNAFYWDEASHNLLCVAKGASPANIFYTSFEDNTGVNGIARTGDRYFDGSSYTIPLSKRPTGNQLVMTYWYFDGEWKFQPEIPYTPIISSPSALRYDEIRVYPKGSQLVTYTYNDLFLVTSKSDPNNVTVKYYYDSLGRLASIRDNSNNLVKLFKYKYRN